ncbi:hypothetical protein ABK040_013164 [Willaertia magna]
MEKYLNNTVAVITCDGKYIMGILEGYDQHTNLIIRDCTENIYDPERGVVQEKLGSYILRGNNIVLIAEIDEEAFVNMKINQKKAIPLKKTSSK